MLKGERSATLSTFIMLPSAIKIFVVSIFEWPLKTGFTVLNYGTSSKIIHQCLQCSVFEVRLNKKIQVVQVTPRKKLG